MGRIGAVGLPIADWVLITHTHTQKGTGEVYVIDWVGEGVTSIECVFQDA